MNVSLGLTTSPAPAGGAFFTPSVSTPDAHRTPGNFFLAVTETLFIFANKLEFKI
jgi:hypothetical protein